MSTGDADFIYARTTQNLLDVRRRPDLTYEGRWLVLPDCGIEHVDWRYGTVALYAPYGEYWSWNPADEPEFIVLVVEVPGVTKAGIIQVVHFLGNNLGYVGPSPPVLFLKSRVVLYLLEDYVLRAVSHVPRVE
jgi:hypothetical protein